MRTPTTYRRVLAAVGLTAAAVLTLALTAGPDSTARADDPPKTADKPKPADGPTEQLAALRKTLFTGGKAEVDAAAPELQRLGKLDLSQSDRETWVRLSRDVAIRQGDRAALDALRDVPDSFGPDVIYTVLLS